MSGNLFREYQFKVYLNGVHSIFIDGRQGQSHPHTWEFILTILIKREEFLEFHVFEKALEIFFSKYQNQTLNDISPFDTIMPTLENMVDYFGGELRTVIRATGGELMKIEGSETPTRSYIVSYEREAEYVRSVEHFTRETVGNIFDSMLDEMEKKK